MKFGYDAETEKYGYIVKEADTDVFVPFKSGGSELTLIHKDSYIAASADHTKSIFKYTFDADTDEVFIFINGTGATTFNSITVLDGATIELIREYSATYSGGRAAFYKVTNCKSKELTIDMVRHQNHSIFYEIYKIS